MAPSISFVDSQLWRELLVTLKLPLIDYHVRYHQNILLGLSCRFAPCVIWQVATRRPRWPRMPCVSTTVCPCSWSFWTRPAGGRSSRLSLAWSATWRCVRRTTPRWENTGRSHASCSYWSAPTRIHRGWVHGGQGSRGFAVGEHSSLCHVFRSFTFQIPCIVEHFFKPQYIIPCTRQV